MGQPAIGHIFETPRLLIRQYTRDDSENFYRMNGDEEIVRYIRAPKSREECNLFLEEVIRYYDQEPLFGRWAVTDKESGSFAGTFALIPVSGTADFQLGYSLLKSLWGRGFASELTKHGSQYFFNNTSFDNLYAITESMNIASRKVLEKCGFTEVRTSTESGREICEYLLLRVNHDKRRLFLSSD